MSVANYSNLYHCALALDIIRRNNATLTELVFRGPTPQPDTLAELRNRNDNYFEPSILNPCFISSLDSTMVKSHLTNLSLNRVCFTHESFTAILRNSPVLRRLKLFRVIVIHYNRDAFSVFKCSSVTSLHASLAEICMPDPGFAWTPCLLHHFPCLEEWHLAAVDRSSNWGIDDYFRDELRECCPRLKTFRFDWMSNTDNLPDLLFHCIRRPESLTFTVNMCEKMALSLITHNNTLTSITITDKCLDLAAMKWVYLISKTCLCLQVYSSEVLILDMASVMEHERGCRDLSKLRVRFKGFESAQAIDALLKLISSLKRNPSSNCVNNSWRQIFNHSRQFDRLTTVCLSTKVYYLAVATA